MPVTSEEVHQEFELKNGKVELSKELCDLIDNKIKEHYDGFRSIVEIKAIETEKFDYMFGLKGTWKREMVFKLLLETYYPLGWDLDFLTIEQNIICLKFDKREKEHPLALINRNV
jgi:hypothetical protein